MKELKDLAFQSRSNPQERLALYVELLEAHVKHQANLLETFKQELEQIIIKLSKEQS
jgi:hypothetical protein